MRGYEMAIHTEIPGLPVSLWKAYRNRRGGGKCLSVEARVWCDEATLYLARSRPRRPLVGLVRLDIVLTSPSVRRWDIENRVKVLSDLLTRMKFWKDDSQIWDLRVRREKGNPEATLITIEPLNSPGFPESSRRGDRS